MAKNAKRRENRLNTLRVKNQPLSTATASRHCHSFTSVHFATAHGILNTLISENKHVKFLLYQIIAK